VGSDVGLRRTLHVWVMNLVRVGKRTIGDECRVHCELIVRYESIVEENYSVELW
jgi:hypothetical protein